MDRLRRLDALFAERVLGKPVYTNPVYGNPRLQEGCAIPHYTRSIDAAWEGVDAAIDDIEMTRQRYGTTHTAHVFAKANGRTGVAIHPAEALVLACLRAVGCSEEELQ